MCPSKTDIYFVLPESISVLTETIDRLLTVHVFMILENIQILKKSNYQYFWMK